MAKQPFILVPILKKLANSAKISKMAKIRQNLWKNYISPIKLSRLPFESGDFDEKNCTWRKCAKGLAKIEKRGQRGPMRVAIMANFEWRMILQRASLKVAILEEMGKLVKMANLAKIGQSAFKKSNDISIQSGQTASSC